MRAAAFLRPLREADWLSPARARGWTRLLAGMSVIAVLASIALSHNGVDAGGKPLGTDFLSFYAAARMAATTGAAAVYDPVRHDAAQQAIFPGLAYGYTTFLYPPTYLLLCLGLAVLPYLAALATWLAAGLALLLAAMRGLAARIGLLPVLAFPGVLVNAGHGQNGCLTAAAFAAYMTLGRRRPGLAGACLGLLVFKPQMALAVPVVLLAAGRARALAAAAATAVAFCALSWAVFGTAGWAAFLAAAPAGRQMLQLGLNGYAKMPGLFAGARLLGAGIGAAWTIQAIVALGVLAGATWLARRRPGAPAEGALMAASALLLSPWSFDYDLLLLAPALAWVADRGIRDGFLPWEKMSLFAAYILPLAARPFATYVGVPLGPPVLTCLFLCVCRRTGRVLF